MMTQAATMSVKQDQDSAALCRKLAAKCWNPLHRQAYLNLALAWDTVAKSRQHLDNPPALIDDGFC